MDAELYKKYFLKGFEDALEKKAEAQTLQKEALDLNDPTDLFGATVAHSIQGAAKGAAIKVLEVAGDSLKKTMTYLRGSKLPRRNQKFITTLMAKDPILKNRPPEKVISQYKTMVNVSPTIALDENVVSSFLRESTNYDNMNTVTIKTLVDLERTIQETRGIRSKQYGTLLGKIK